MTELQLVHPMVSGIIASANSGAPATVAVPDVDGAVSWLDAHGGTRELQREGNVISGVFLGIDFTLCVVAC